MEIVPFYFGNVVTNKNYDRFRAFEHLLYLDSTAFDFCFERFTIRGIIKEAGKD